MGIAEHEAIAYNPVHTLLKKEGQAAKPGSWEELMLTPFSASQRLPQHKHFPPQLPRWELHHHSTLPSCHSEETMPVLFQGYEYPLLAWLEPKENKYCNTW